MENENSYEAPTPAAWEMSPEIDKISGALAKAQGEIVGALKDRENPHFKSRYADLASIWDACRKPLSANEIAVIQMPEVGVSEVAVTTLLTHASGQWVRSRISAMTPQTAPQNVGSAVTYLRRYSLAAMAGVAPDDDDDGNAAQEGAQRMSGQRPQPAAAPPAASQAAIAAALEMIAGVKSAAAYADVAAALDKEFPKGDGKRPNPARAQIVEALKAKKEALSKSCKECGLKGGAHEPGCPCGPQQEEAQREPGAEG